MRYIIDIPDDKKYTYVNDEKTFFKIPISLGENEIKSISAPTFLRITPYTEPDEDESYGASKYKSIGLAFLKWLGDDAGDKLKSADDVYRFLDKNCYNKNAVEQEVWEFAKYIAYHMDRNDYIECFDEKYYPYTYQEAKSKYEEWKKQKEEESANEFLVGDEVIGLKGSFTGVVTKVYGGGGYLAILGKYGFGSDKFDAGNFRKTGRHFDEVEELLEKMRGEEE